MKPPIIILCYSRSGSTVLRYILDAHPSVFCPPELHLAAILSNIEQYLSNSLYPRISPDEGAVTEQSEAAVSNLAECIISEILDRFGNERFCDKSVTTTQHIGITMKAFPDAQFICLHRNAFDHQQSALEAMRKVPDIDSFGFEKFVNLADGDIRKGLIDYWLHNERVLMDFERIHEDRTFSIRYEDLVLQSNATLSSLFKFLGLNWQEDVVEAAFTRPHIPGPGDWKIRQTKRLHADSIGRWKRKDIEEIDVNRLHAVEKIHASLGYDREEMAGFVAS